MSVLFFVYLLQLSSFGEIVEFDFFLLFVGFLYVVSLIYIGLLFVVLKYLILQVYLQFVGDFVLVIGFVYQFGGMMSLFLMLYFIVISVVVVVLW